MKIIKHWQINKGDTSKWKIIPCSWSVRNNAGKIVMLSKAIYKFNVIPPKISMAFFTDIEKHSWSSYGATRGSKEPKQHWGNKSRATIPYHKPTTANTTWHCHQSPRLTKQNREQERKPPLIVWSVEVLHALASSFPTRCQDFIL